MCLLLSEAIEAIVKVKRKNDCNFFKDCAIAIHIAMAFFLHVVASRITIDLYRF